MPFLFLVSREHILCTTFCWTQPTWTWFSSLIGACHRTQADIEREAIHLLSNEDGQYYSSNAEAKLWAPLRVIVDVWFEFVIDKSFHIMRVEYATTAIVAIGHFFLKQCQCMKPKIDLSAKLIGAFRFAFVIEHNVHIWATRIAYLQNNSAFTFLNDSSLFKSHYSFFTTTCVNFAIPQNRSSFGKLFCSCLIDWK